MWKSSSRLVLMGWMVALTLSAPALSGAVPMTTVVEGVLTSTGGGPVADGQYVVKFALYEAANSAVPAWTETSLAVDLIGGRFMHRLGSIKAVDAVVFAKLTTPHLGLQVGMDPELPRRALDAVPFAWRAASADSLACSGCVTAAMLDAQALAAYVTTASLADVALTGDYADLSGTPSLAVYAKTESLAKVATTGQFGDLAGAPPLGAGCGTGLVVRGLKADGSYDCVAVVGLPSDGLSQVSNNQLSNVFQDVFALPGTPIGIPDNNPVGTGGEIDVPDLGTARTITASVEVANSDISTVRVLLWDPTNTEYVLHDKSGSGTVLKTSYPSPTKPASGDLSTWIGKNPKGKWRVAVVDGKFLNNGNDGALKTFTLTVETLSSGKTLAKGVMVLQGGVQLPLSAADPFACDAGHLGYTYLNTKSNDVFVCRGKWTAVMFRDCGNGLVELPEQCDNGQQNADQPDKCRTTCVKPKCGDAIKDTGEFCDDGNAVADDGCPNDCSNPNPILLFTAVGLNSQTPPVTLGTLPAKVGKQLVIQKIGMCGDSDAGSGPNTFSVNGAGLSFTWATGQSNPNPTHWLSPTVASGASRGFTYADVNYVGQVGQGADVAWDYHNDWDGYRCTGTDALGNVYDDPTASSVRVWVQYTYK